jgi:Mce-associated membrane protein
VTDENKNLNGDQPTADEIGSAVELTEPPDIDEADEADVLLTSAGVATGLYFYRYRDLANVKPSLTGDFLSYYPQFTEQIVTPAARENPDGAFAASSVKVDLKKIDGRWLMSAFDPV